jgi:hypothetical protein
LYFLSARIFVPGNPFQPSLMFVSKAREYSRMEHLRGASIDYAMALLANIRLGWKSPLGTNTLAYYEHWQIADEQSRTT